MKSILYIAGILNCIYTGIGIAFGTVTGGVIIRSLGIRAAFQLLAGLSGLNLLVMNLVLYIDSKLATKSSYQPLSTSAEEDQ